MKPAYILLTMVALWTTFASTGYASQLLPSCNEENLSSSCVLQREQVGPWTVENISPGVGTQNAVRISTPSFEMIPGLFGREEPAILTLACVEGVTHVEVRFGENFMSDAADFGTFVYRLDDAPSAAIAASASDDNFALGIFKSPESNAVIESFFGSNRLFVSATSFTGRNITATFAIEGVQDAVLSLRTLCNW